MSELNRQQSDPQETIVSIHPFRQFIIKMALNILTDLPREIRDQIYRDVFSDAIHLTPLFNDQKNVAHFHVRPVVPMEPEQARTNFYKYFFEGSLDAEFLLVSKQIRKEGRNHLFRHRNIYMLVNSLALYVKESAFKPFLDTTHLGLRCQPRELLTILFSLESCFESFILLQKLRSVYIVFELTQLEDSTWGLCHYTDETMDQLQTLFLGGPLNGIDIKIEFPKTHGWVRSTLSPDHMKWIVDQLGRVTGGEIWFGGNLCWKDRVAIEKLEFVRFTH
jgi:hypothetical protein